MDEENKLDPNKYIVLDKKKKKILILVLLFLVLVVIPPLGYLYYNFAVNRPNQTNDDITFEIKKGEILSLVADNLYEAGAINSKFLFNLYARANGLDRNIQAGIYTVSAGTSIKELVDQFQHGTYERSITFLEGWRIEEFARRAEEEFKNVSYEDFITVAGSDEGYLFPDTYFFNEDATAKDIVDHLRDVFDTKTKDLLSDDYLDNLGLTKEEVVTLASIVEREARNEDDRSVVAGILIKRLKEGMKLEADATVQYAVGGLNVSDYTTHDFWPRDLTAKDLAYDSPYNTRKNGGLPPAPISSFSLSALKAVVNYSPSEYYFYLNDNEGNTYFAKTLDEHNANISKYLSY